MQVGEDARNHVGIAPVFLILRGIADVEGDALFSLA